MTLDHDIEQRSEEWHEIRIGKITASRVQDLLATTKSGPSASRKNYIVELMLERLTGERPEHFTNAAMQWGVDNEPAARSHYEFLHNVEVQETGFVIHPHMENCGASPDGLVGDKGLIEIKCPNSATHLATLTGSKIPAKYYAQMQLQMACCQRDWCDFVSYDPRFPEEMKFHEERVLYDADFVRNMTAEIEKADYEIEQKIAELKGAE